MPSCCLERRSTTGWGRGRCRGEILCGGADGCCTALPFELRVDVPSPATGARAASSLELTCAALAAPAKHGQTGPIVPLRGGGGRPHA